MTVIIGVIVLGPINYVHSSPGIILLNLMMIQINQVDGSLFTLFPTHGHRLKALAITTLRTSYKSFLKLLNKLALLIDGVSILHDLLHNYFLFFLVELELLILLVF